MSRTADMDNSRWKFTAAAALAVLAAAASAGAEPIFRWVDEDGVVHFSDAAPRHTDEVTTLFINPTNPPGYDPADDPYSIESQAERTRETWSELEARREARREKQREADREAREAARREAYRPYAYDSRPYYFQPPYYRPGRPPYRPRPPHTRPPVSPPTYPDRPAWPIKAPADWTDPMRSAHIGVRRSPPPNSPHR